MFIKQLLIGVVLLVSAYYLYNWSAKTFKADSQNAAKQASSLGIGLIVDGIAIVMALIGAGYILGTLICGPSKSLI